MKNRYILFLLSAFLMAMVVLGSASAFDFSFLFGGNDTSEAQNITIDGVDFQIPAGFNEDEKYAINNQTNNSGSISYKTNGKTFTNDKNDVISIGVALYDGYKVDDEFVGLLGGNKTTYNGQTGYLIDQSGLFMFNYARNGKLVIITTNDDSIIEELII